MDVIFFIGPQGSGKGTQAKILAEKLNFFYWDMGAILREKSAFTLSDGKTVGEIINQGIILTDKQLSEVLEKCIGEVLRYRGIIFDGVPRRIGQAQFLMDYLKQQNRKQFTTIFLDLPAEESVQRLLLRAKKEGRSDDTVEIIDRRLRQYEEVTKPVLDFLKERTEFHAIDGRPSVEKIARNIEKKLGLRGTPHDTK